MYNYSDAWFLAALILIKDWASLQKVIAFGDWLDHAIFTQKEINDALSVLTPLGYVEINHKKEMRATEKAYNLCNSGFNKAGLFDIVSLLLDNLKSMPFVEQPNKVVFFTKDEIKKAYDQYVGKDKK